MAGAHFLHVVHYPVFGGPHNQALRLAAPLRERGWQTTVLIPDEPGNAGPRLEAGGVEVVKLRLGRLRATPSPATQLRFLAGLKSEVESVRRLLRERDMDIVVVVGLVNPHAAIAARLEGLPVVWQLVDTRPQMALRRVLMPLVGRLADVLMTTGTGLGSSHPGAAHFAERLIPFFPPVDCKEFHPTRELSCDVRAAWGLGEEDLVIGSTSNISPQKGIEHLIDAAALLHARDERTKLVLVGSEYDTHRSYSAALRTRLQNHGLRDGQDVIFVGGRSDIERQLQGFDIFVMGSVPNSEGVPTSILEAMACGVPVVATDVGGVREVVEEGVTGFVVPPLNPEAIADATLRLLRDPALRSRMDEEARRQAVERYDVAVCAETHVQAFQAAIAHRAVRKGKGITRPRAA